MSGELGVYLAISITLWPMALALLMVRLIVVLQDIAETLKRK